MDENQNNEHRIINENYHYSTCDKHPFWKALLTGLLTFLGAFCAFYVVSDWHFKRMMHPPIGKMDRMMRKEMREMDKMFKTEQNLSKYSAHVIHLEQSKDAYKIYIDLKSFDNNEDNVKVSANGNILTINGQSIRKSKRNEQITEFQQSYMFGDNVNLKNMTKEVQGHYYVITIPTTEMDD